MARGNNIIVNPAPRGIFMEGVMAASQTPKPGTIMQMDATVALVSGRHTFTPYSRDADGDMPKGPLWVLLPDRLQGKTVTDAYAAGDRCFLYCPLAGDELNLLLDDISGTTDDHAAGEILMVDTETARLIATTGSPESEPFLLLEAITDPVADTLAWVIYTGY